MKKFNKKILSLVLAISFISILLFSVSNGVATDSKETDLNSFSLSTQTTETFEGFVDGGEIDWFTVEAEPGLMELSVSWANNYDIDCYISTTASTSNYLARGYTTSNPESCSYNIETSGTYYIGIKMYSSSWWWSINTAYTATLNYYIGGSGGDTTPPSVSINSPTNGATVSNIVNIEASASDLDSGINYLQCKIDANSWTNDLTSPYVWEFDTTAVSDGTHSITLRAYDNAGNYADDTIDVVVSNAGPVDNEIFSGVPVSGNLAVEHSSDMYFINVGTDAISMSVVLTCGAADFDVYGKLNAEPTTSTYDWRGYTSGGEEVTVNNPGSGIWYIMVKSYSGTGNYELTVTVESNTPNPDAEKIAVFFWASDAGAQWIIDEYYGVLQLEGYTKIYNFEDTSDFQGDFNSVDAYAGPEDTVFFYLFGHGNNNGVDSYTAFRPNSMIVYSSEFRTMMDGFDVANKGFLIESCHSGGWAEDFEANPYLAMSTSDATHNSYAVGNLPNEGIFSDAFFNHVQSGYNGVDSFNYAKQVVFDGASSDTYMQYPQIADYCSYVWFN